MTRVYDPVQLARQFLFVRETLGANNGVFVEAIQRLGDGRPGDSWCCDFVSFILWIAYQGPNPLPRTGSCDVMFAVAEHNNYVVPFPQIGDIFFRVKNGDAHHVGFVTQTYPDRVGTISGNTSADGLSSNGDGVHEHDVPLGDDLRFVRLPLAL